MVQSMDHNYEVYCITFSSVIFATEFKQYWITLNLNSTYSKVMIHYVWYTTYSTDRINYPILSVELTRQMNMTWCSNSSKLMM